MAATPDALWRSDSAHARNPARTRPVSAPPFVSVRAQAPRCGERLQKKLPFSCLAPPFGSGLFEDCLTFLRFANLRAVRPSNPYVHIEPTSFVRSHGCHRYLSVGDGLRLLSSHDSRLTFLIKTRRPICVTPGGDTTDLAIDGMGRRTEKSRDLRNGKVFVIHPPRIRWAAGYSSTIICVYCCVSRQTP